MDEFPDGIHVLVRGRVQGVGFRYFVKQAADALGVAGWVRNLHDGRVEAVLVGPEAQVQPVLDQMVRGPRNAQVDELATRPASSEESGAAMRPLLLRETN
ncbi:MAG TPA: acylphosphatase [Lautropia sp.]|nr:acylphosphatase [Lautropia sp.]